jgi:hypothetical protein
MSIEKQLNDETPSKGDEFTRCLPPRNCPYRAADVATGLPCALCDLPVVHPDVEYRVEWYAAGEQRRSRFHLACYHLWFDS